MVIKDDEGLGDTMVVITCPKHGDFYMRANDHLGKNKESIAYGCAECKKQENSDA